MLAHILVTFTLCASPPGLALVAPEEPCVASNEGMVQLTSLPFGAELQTTSTPHSYTITLRVGGELALKTWNTGSDLESEYGPAWETLGAVRETLLSEVRAALTSKRLTECLPRGKAAEKFACLALGVGAGFLASLACTNVCGGVVGTLAAGACNYAFEAEHEEEESANE